MTTLDDPARRSSHWSYTAPALLVAVAAIQAVVVRASDLCPWKGGGFAMFSTLDRPANRMVRARVVGDAGHEVPLMLRDVRGLDPRALERALILPDERTLRTLAQTVARAAGAAAGKNHALELSVWRMRYDRTLRELRREPIRTVTVPSPSPHRR